MITQERERAAFITNWKNKPPQYRSQGIEEVASWHRESNRKKAKGIDFYYYDVDKEGHFISPANGQRVGSCNRDGYVGRVEGEIVDEMERQRKIGEEVFIWVSPQYPNVYYDVKVTITKKVICEGRECWENRAIILEYDKKQGLELAQKIADSSKNRPLLSSLEEVRQTSLIIDSQMDWINILVEVTGDDEIGKVIREGEDKKAKQEALEKSAQFYDELLGEPTIELKIGEGNIWSRYGFGDSLSSCPVILGLSKEGEYWRKGNCRMCHESIVLVGPCLVCKKCEDYDNYLKRLVNLWVGLS